jgi:hypothetical protein
MIVSTPLVDAKEEVISVESISILSVNVALPVTIKLPVITAEPENGNPAPEPPPSLVKAYEAVMAYEEVIIELPPKGPYTFDAVT